MRFKENLSRTKLEGLFLRNFAYQVQGSTIFQTAYELEYIIDFDFMP